MSYTHHPNGGNLPSYLRSALFRQSTDSSQIPSVTPQKRRLSEISDEMEDDELQGIADLSVGIYGDVDSDEELLTIRVERPDDDKTVDADPQDDEPRDVDLAQDGSSDTDSEDGVPEAGEPNNGPGNDRPLEEWSAWYRHPTKENILRLAGSSKLDDFPDTGDYMPEPTVRDVKSNAMASVRFLEELTRSGIDSSKMGIDHAGRLYLLRYPRDEDNFREAFTYLALDIRTRVRLRDQMRKVQAALMAIDDWGCEYYSDRHAVREAVELHECAEVMMKETSFSVKKLESILPICEQAVEKLDRIISVVNSVKQILTDTGSTTLSRWNEVKSMDWFFSTRFCSEMDGMIPTRSDQLAKLLAGRLLPWQRFFGLALNLKERITEAIDGTRDWWYTLEKSSLVLGVKAPPESSLLVKPGEEA